MSITRLVGPDPKAWIILFLGLGLALSLVTRGCGSPDDDVTEADRLRTQLTAERARAAGWGLALAESQKDLYAAWSSERERGDSLEQETSALLQELHAAEAELVFTSRMVTQLEGQLEVAATVHRDSLGNTPDSATAELDDGLLRGRVAYYFGPAAFDLTYRAEVEAALVAAEMPDRRLMVSARALDPRVTLQVEDLRYQLPAPVEYCTWGERGRWGAAGFIGGGVLGLVFGG